MLRLQSAGLLSQNLEVKVIFKELRINEEIRAAEIRLVSDNEEEQLGIVSVKEALRTARERELDLVEIAPNAKPPVCKLMDYGKYRFDQLKRDKEEHDFEVKAKNAQKFLAGKDKVKVTIMFRGREITHPEQGIELCRQMAERLADVASVEKAAKVEGRNMTMILAPK